MSLFDRLLHRQPQPGKRPNPANLDETLTAAARASCHPDNAGAVIVVVEMGGIMERDTGEFVARRYNYWSHHPSENYGKAATDFNTIPTSSRPFSRAAAWTPMLPRFGRAAWELKAETNPRETARQKARRRVRKNPAR